MENYSLSDLAAVTDGNGFGGNSAWILIILFALIFGWGGNGMWGNRSGDFGQFATSASQSEILLGQQFQNLNQAINQVGDGLASSTYALTNQINGAQTTLGGAITSEGRAIQTQIANCCCQNQQNVDSVRYDMANFAAAINSNIDNKFAAIEKNSLEQRIQDQASQIQQLQIQSAMCGVVRYPNASTYSAGYSPFCGCGCGN